MRALALCLVSAPCLLPSAFCAACPPVAVPQAAISVQPVAPQFVLPQVAVQSFAIAQQPLAVHSFAVAAQPLAVQSFAVQALAAPERGQAVCNSGVRARGGLLGGRRLLPRSKSVSIVR
jgi:hypothetical protein